MPGPTDTDFFERADMEDTAVAKGSKDDPAAVAEQGFAAMMKGASDLVVGWRNKVQITVANAAPAISSTAATGWRRDPTAHGTCWD
jgi:uncharacterized protein